MQTGWIKIHRKILDSPVWDNHNVFRVWMWCLMKASHKEHPVLVGNQPIELKPGQFVCGRDSAARETGLTPQNIRSCFQALRTMENITIKTTNKFSIITIINWDAYQDKEKETTSKSTNNQPTDNQQITTNKNGENDKNEKKTTISPEILGCVNFIIDSISSTAGNLAPKKTNTLITKSADTVEKLIRIDGFSLEYIKNVIEWAMQDDFWCKNVLSLTPLRNKSKNGLTKFQNIANKYDQEGKTNNSQRSYKTLTSAEAREINSRDA